MLAMREILFVRGGGRVVLLVRQVSFAFYVVSVESTILKCFEKLRCPLKIYFEY